MQTQKQRLIHHFKENKIENFKIIKDLGSGLNFNKKGLNELINLIVNSKVDTIYATYKDRLLRFGSELIINIAKKFGTKIIFLNSEIESFETNLTKDVLEIKTVYSAKLYGSRSHKNKKLISKAN